MANFRHTHHTCRYPDTRWNIRCGTYRDIEAFAANELQRALQAFVPYTIEVAAASAGESAEDAAGQGNLAVMGTPQGNHLIADLLEHANLSLPEHEQGYAVTCMPAPWNAAGRQVLLIAASTANGLLHGVEDLCTRILGSNIIRDDPLQLSLPASMPVFSLTDYPRIAHRGIWTWGYVIYDYRRFIDNMARLRMNMLTVWNDVPPINMPQVIDHAHSRGIRVILGFPWGWGMDLDLADPADQARLKQDVLHTYEQEYSGLAHDGIYFQTLTETRERTVGGRPRAEVACEVVNDIARALLERHPGLHIQFGLHATSIMDDYPMLASLDPRVTITWEDAGVIPYAYDVTNSKTSPEGTTGGLLADLESTMDYSRKIAALRPGCPFALVPKGFAKLRWASEFEHHGSFIMGERSRNFIRTRLDREQASWDRKNILWHQHYTEAARFFREVLAVNPHNMLATALIEDGLFEERIQPCVSLFAQVLWNPCAKAEDFLTWAHSAYLGGSF